MENVCTRLGCGQRSIPAVFDVTCSVVEFSSHHNQTRVTDFPRLQQDQEAQDAPLPLAEGRRPQVPPQPSSRSARHREGSGTLGTHVSAWVFPVSNK